MDKITSVVFYAPVGVQHNAMLSNSNNKFLKGFAFYTPSTQAIIHPDDSDVFIHSQTNDTYCWLKMFVFCSLFNANIRSTVIYFLQVTRKKFIEICWLLNRKLFQDKNSFCQLSRGLKIGCKQAIDCFTTNFLQ
jgi:hypothetical protein